MAVPRPDVVVVQFVPGSAPGEGSSRAGLAAFDRAASRMQVRKLERVAPFLDRFERSPAVEQVLDRLRRTFYVYLGSGVDPHQASAWFGGMPDVVYAAPLFVYPLNGSLADPNDAQFSAQTHLRHMRLPQAWDIVKGEDGDPRVVIAIVDNGTDWLHEDLRDNIWTNVDEVADNGLDDDQNGFIDDVRGVNFANEDPTDNDPAGLPDLPESGIHGTASATAAGAVTNNQIGLSGSSWNATIMPVNVGCKDAAWGICFGYEGVAYAAANGADIINTSWGDEGLTEFERDMLEFATNSGALVVTAAGNFQTDLIESIFNPAGFPRALTVGATEKDTRAIAVFSNYGMPVDVYAPGVSIEIGMPDNLYYMADGTSFSSPLVAGVAALVKTRFPELTPDQLREQIRLSSTPIDVDNPAYAGAVGGGYINAEAAVKPAVHPAMRIKRWSWIDTDGDGAIRAGEAVRLNIVFVNHLADASNLSIGLQELNTQYLTVSPDKHNIGRLSAGDSVEVEFNVIAASGTPPYARSLLATHISDGAFFDSPDFVYLNLNSDPQTVKDALQTLFTATEGAYWTQSDNWGMPVSNMENFAAWHGVIVTRGQVAKLSLESNNLGGTLPGSALATLGALDELNFGNNYIGGPIPIELAQLSRLKSLRLSTNNFTGVIPPELGQLSNLTQLRLSRNELSGQIPSGLGQLSRLEFLDLSSNRLTGQIPASFGQLAFMHYLDLSKNDLSGQLPAEFGRMFDLGALNLSDNNLTGQLPLSLSNLLYLESLQFDGQELCSPPEPSFQDWLTSLPNWSGPVCTGMWFRGSIETQVFTAGLQGSSQALPEASGGQSPYTYAVSPALPAGLSFDATARIISGTPSAVASAATFAFTATDAGGAMNDMTFTLEINSPLAFSGTIPDQSYVRAVPIPPLTLPSAVGGTPPIAYAVTTSLPEGLVFDAEHRLLFGVPTTLMAPTQFRYSATGAFGSSAEQTFSIEVVASLSSHDDEWPEEFTVHGNYPNPFRGETTIAFDLPRPALVSLTVIDLLGRSVRSMPARHHSAGSNQNLRVNLSGLGAGLYFYRMHTQSQTDSNVRSGSLVLMR